MAVSIHGRVLLLGPYLKDPVFEVHIGCPLSFGNL